MTKLLLGGQITATKSAESLGTVSDTQKRDAMKWSAAVSVESKYVSGSVSGGQEKIDAVNVHNSTLQNAAALAWAARGGNTLLAPK